MPSSENHGSSLSFASFGRTLLTMRREQVHSSEAVHDSSAEDPDVASFQREVSVRFRDLCSVGDDELLSLDWIKKLLDTFIICQEDFRFLLLNKKTHISRPPMDRLVTEYFEKSVKALDICNATRDGIERLHQCKNHLEIVMSALGSSHQRSTISEGQLRRARKALMELAIAMLDEKESGSDFSHRNRSFGRHNRSKDRHHSRQPGHSRSRSWSVSHSWSAAKQLQSIGNGLVPPNRGEILASNGLAVPVFAMSCVLMFVLWVLVAAIPCQDRGLQCHFSIPRHFSWGVPLLLLHERVTEESKKRDRRNSNGLLKEINDMERCARCMTDFVDSVEVPLTEEQKAQLKKGIGELSFVCGVLKSGLDPLERQVREVFRKIMSCRVEGLDLLAKSNSSE